MISKGLMDTAYYRGLSKNYAGSQKANSDFSDNFKPSYFRSRRFDLEAENKHYAQMLHYIREFNIQLKSNIELNDASPKYALKILGYIQHYGFESRLLDVSSDKKVAEYFACSDNFDSGGYVVSFNGESIVPKSPDAAVTVHYKLKDFLKQDLSSNHILFKKKHIIVDYTKLFTTNSTNYRYERQSGAFILFTSTDTSLNYHLEEGADYSREVIPTSKKIAKLLEVSRNGKNYVELFPDSEVSMQIYALYESFSSHQISLRDVAKRFGFDNEIVDLDRFEPYLGQRHVFYLFFKEFLPLLRNGNEKFYMRLLQELNLDAARTAR